MGMWEGSKVPSHWSGVRDEGSWVAIVMMDEDEGDHLGKISTRDRRDFDILMNLSPPISHPGRG